MNGLINRAVEQFVVSMKGEAGWRGVCADAGIQADGFVSMQSYDDELTYRLVDAASKRLALPPVQVLQAIGKLWITYIFKEGYGDVITATGTNLREFLTNLNEMHCRIEIVFTKMRAPQFRIEDVSDTEFRLCYASERSGLAPMVIGIVDALAQHFGQSVEIIQVYAKTEIDSEDIFLIRHLP